MDLGVPIPYKPKVPITTTTVTGFGSFRQRLHPTIIDTLILDMKFESMTPVQEQTMTPLLDGLDCHIQAKTGTGKTIAFLVPSIDKILKTKQQGISLLVIAPTRELALQIADSAKQVCARFNDIKVGIAIGGTNVKTERDIILRGLNILIATPGRLLDHLTDANVATQLYYLQTFVLDEADRLLDMGFSPDILKIIQYLPKTRQSLLCSATVTPRVSELAARVLRQEYVFLTTIVKGESNTHEKIRQTLVTAPFTQQLLMTISILMLPEHKDSKVIVFLPTAHLANLYHAVCSVQFPSSLVQHARQSQKKRTTVSEQFRDCKQGILFATDVVARGMDFPNVQLVIQVGVCDSRETYIHRIGRTGRSEQEGKAYLILAPEESYFLKRLKGIKIESNHVPVCLDSFSIQKKGVQAYKHEANDEMTAVYQSWLGFYKAELKNIGWSPAQLVQEANVFAGQVLDCDDVPPIKAQTVGKMGLKGVPGLNIVRRS
ncbi:DEAD box RNA helicase hela [Gorgonomyces haynaldii]|nr:DEAD box RNA helicase hela [Gorgonomyces haynaldii]